MHSLNYIQDDLVGLEDLYHVASFYLFDKFSVKSDNRNLVNLKTKLINCIQIGSIIIQLSNLDFTTVIHYHLVIVFLFS